MLDSPDPSGLERSWRSSPAAVGSRYLSNQIVGRYRLAL